MIDHVSIGVRDIAKAKAFYDAALAPLGYACLSSSETSLGYGKDAAALWVVASTSPVPPDPNSGLHFCLAAPAPASKSRRRIIRGIPISLSRYVTATIATCEPLFRAPC